ncbi:hypothetical protein BGX30_011828, partial [Mortierella sp. GBA39]
MDSNLEFLGSFDVSDSQGTVVAPAEEDEAQDELLFPVLCRTRPTPGADGSGDEEEEEEEEEEEKAGDEGMIAAPTPPTPVTSGAC